MVLRSHLLAKTKRASNATEATPPPMSSKVKSACPALTEVTVSMTELTGADGGGDGGGGEGGDGDSGDGGGDGGGGTYAGHSRSY